MKNNQRHAIFGLALALAAGFAIFPTSLMAAAPTITSFAPTSGPVGTKVVIKGTNLSSPTAVTFDGTNASSFTGVSATQVTATVAPTGTGPISVKNAGGTATSGAAFTVTPGLQLSQATGYPTVSFTVTGEGFGPYTSVDVYFDTTDIALAVSNGLGVVSIAIQVPVSSQPGAHWITLDERANHFAAQKPFTVNTNWPMQAFGPGGAGVNPFENTLSASNVDNLGTLWTQPSGGFANASPFIEYNGNVFLGDVLGGIRALGSTGALLWSAGETDSFQSVTPASNGTLVFFGGTGSTVYAFKNTCRTDGGVCAPTWTSDIGVAITAGLTLRLGVLYVPTADGTIHLLNPSTGAAAGAPIFGYDSAHGAVTTPIAFAADGTFYYGNTAILQFREPSWYSWQYPTELGTVSPFTINAGRPYYTTNDGVVHGTTTGWTQPTSGTGCAPAPVVAGNLVFAGGCSTISAFEASSGALQWNVTTPAPVLGLSVANGVVYACVSSLGASGGLTAYDASYGGLLWSGGGCTTAPVVANGIVFGAYADISAYGLPGVNLVGNTAAPRLRELKPDFALAAQRTAE